MSYECNDCSRFFSSTQAVVSHCNARGHSCSSCTLCGGRVFTDEYTLDQHLMNAHSYCNQCDKAFVHDDALHNHFRNSPKHCGTYCRQCSKNFQDETARTQHYRTSPEHRDTYCVQCDKLFEDEYAKQQHIQSSPAHRVYYNLCHICNKTFRDEQALKQHIRDSPAHKQVGVLAGKTYCSICDKRFKKPEDLQRHNASPVHRERNTPCFVCNSKFKTASGLAQHIECSCRNLPFNRHQITDAVRSLNIIPNISARLEGSPAIQRPLITYQATEDSFNGSGYQCHLCLKAFRSLHSLGAHLNSPAHDDDEFQCPKCDTEFKLISGLVQHLESRACGLSSIEDVERRFYGLTAQFSRSLAF